MLAESKQKNEALSQAYSVLHTEYLKVRTTQARPQQPPRHSIAIPFDHSTMGVGMSNGGIDLDGMFVFQDMPSYPNM
jgi:AP-1-like transcription factor